MSFNFTIEKKMFLSFQYKTHQFAQKTPQAFGSLGKSSAPRISAVTISQQFFSFDCYF